MISVTAFVKHVLTCPTYSHVIDSHAHSAVVINLLRGNRLSLICQEDAQEQQQAFISIHHTWRHGQERRGDNLFTPFKMLEKNN